MPEEYPHQPEQTEPEDYSVLDQEPKRSFWQRNGATIITVAVLGLIIGGAIAINEQRKSDDETLAENTGLVDTDSSTSATSTGSTTGNNATSTPTATTTPSTGSSRPAPAVGQNMTVRVTETTVNGQTKATAFEVTAERGDGLTHLARKAITEQLRRSDSNLTPEHRVYAEDYLQKKYAPKVKLHPGDTVTFSADQVNESINASQNLSSAQLQNLHKYSVLVNWPPI